MLNLFGKSFFIHSVARESVLILIFDAHSFLQDHCVGLFLDFGSAGIVRRRFFSVLVVNDGDSEIVSFFGRASFVLYLRSVEDRMCTWDQQKCVNALHALLDIGSTNATIDVPKVLMHEPQFVFNLCQQHHIAMHQC